MKTTKYLGIAALAFGLAAFTACSDDDEASSTSMSISQVYLEDADATVKDRPVTFARLGQMLRIEGTGFTGLKRVYVNGYKTDFNNSMVTDNNIWITLSGNTEIAKADSAVRNTIQLYKSDNNIYTYPFIVRAAAPQVTSIDNTMPKANEKVTVSGTNLQQITSITLPDGTKITSGIESDDDKGEYYSFTMPEGADSKGGSITAEGANGTAISPANFCQKSCVLLDFDGNGDQGGWSATYTSDDLVTDPLNSGRGNVVPVVPASVLSEAGIKNGAAGKGWFTAGNGDDFDDWSRFYDIIPSDTRVEDIALQFDIYCPEPWEGAGYLEFTFQNNLSSYGWGTTETKNTTNIKYPTAVCWCPWIDTATGKTTPFQTTGWQTVTIPVSNVGKYQEPDTYTFADVVADRDAASYKNFGMFLVNADITLDDGENTFETGVFNQMIYVDNWRIVPNKSTVVSDYPDEEEE